ncbi:hypothetical protein [Novosphingobium aquimarinum]|nr:hypothetical protein [Novosphingobium aquimarinum]
MKRTFKRRLPPQIRTTGSREWPSEIDWIAALVVALWINGLGHLLLG